jgi:hypothetical protein
MEEFRALPLLTQSAVAGLILAGLIVHILRFGPKVAHDGPAIFTTIGIFFTFLGIALGLYNFHVENIEASLPALLAGLKTAFWASVAGVFIALTIKLRYALFGVSSKSRAGDLQGATIDDLMSQLVRIQESLAGEDDATLISQMKLSRQDANDRLDALRKSQQEFMDKMAENNSKALIQALQEVIRDFNTKINEQFGENFKQLNSAVEKILIWQERYRQQMQEMIGQQETTARNMATASERYEMLVTNAERFNVVSEQLVKLLSALDLQRNQIELSLRSLGQLLTAASGSLPQIEQKIVELTQQVTNGVRTNHDEVTRALRETSTSLQNAAGDVKRLMTDAFHATNQEFNGHMSQIANKTREQVAMLDVALDRELTKALDTLARQLTALSQKFVEDYTPLTDKLTKLVNVSRGLQ